MYHNGENLLRRVLKRYVVSTGGTAVNTWLQPFAGSSVASCGGVRCCNCRCQAAIEAWMIQSYDVIDMVKPLSHAFEMTGRSRCA